MLENKNYLYVLLSFFCISIFSQKKKLDHKDFDVWNTIQTPLSDAGKMGYITPEEVESFARLLVQKATSSPIWQLFRRIINKWWIQSLKDH